MVHIFIFAQSPMTTTQIFRSIPERHPYIRYSIHYYVLCESCMVSVHIYSAMYTRFCGIVPLLLRTMQRGACAHVC